MTSPGDPEPKMADPPTRWYCNYCQDELKSFSIKCCKCPDFDLCLQCFSSGAEIGTHRRDDNYQIVDHALFEGSNWSVSEEYALLDGVETFGFGNWADATNHVGTKSQTEVTEHYNSTYILGNIGRVTVPVKLPSKVIDHTGPDGGEGPLSPSLSTSFKPVDITLQDQSELGYMPHRDDFEREHDNDAETLVSHLAVTIEDDDLDISLKLAHVDIYTSRLKERLRRKKISRDYGLIVAACSSTKQKQAANKHDKSKKQLSKHESDFRDKLKPFAQFMTPTDQEQLYENIQKEKRLRAKIKELLKYRRNGITKHEECAEYEAARFKREKRKESRKRLAEKAKGRVLSAKKEKEKQNKIEAKEEPIIKKEKEVEKEKDKDDRELVEDEFKAIKSSPGFNFLSDREKKLCNSMKMRPARYITLKALIIKDHLLRKQGIPHKTRYPSNLDKAHRKRIFNYLTKSGWIKSS